MSATQHRIKIQKHTLKKVTVFNNRAELKREFSVELVPGLNEVIIEGASCSLNDDSVRVTDRGSAVIKEVQVADRRVAKGAGDSERAKKIRTEYDDLKEKRRVLDDEKTTLTKRIESFDNMIGQVGTGIVAPKKAKLSADQETFDTVDNLFNFYDKRVTELRHKLAFNKRVSEQTEEEFKLKIDELSLVTGPSSGKYWRTTDYGDYIKDISILLDSTEGGKVVLELSYQVSDAIWKPFYDVRVDTKEGKTGMEVSYHGNVKQSTGEDWEGVELTLSTAGPSLNGTIPSLGTLDASLIRPVPSKNVETSGRITVYGLDSQASGDSEESDDDSSREEREEIKHKVAAVSSHVLSTEFTITGPCSIPSDGINHKVTIGTVALEPQLAHESVPTKNASAFLTASALNSSSLPLLAGKASVYLDGAFVAKTHIKAVSPGERFTSSLGVDPAVKIEYKPAHKHHEEYKTSMFNKMSSTVTEQKIIVKNTRGDAILLTIKEQIPKSTDEKIKVKIISPEAFVKVKEEMIGENHKPTEGVKLMPSNNLEWTVKLEKGETKTLIVKYSIDHPSNEKIEFAERRN